MAKKKAPKQLTAEESEKKAEETARKQELAEKVKRDKAEAADNAKREQARKRKLGEGWPHWKQDNKVMELSKLSERLRKEQQNQNNAAAILPGLVREHTRLLESRNDEALKNWVDENKAVTRSQRWKQHDAFREAQIHLEDFLYYQNPIHRALRVRDQDQEERDRTSGKRRRPKNREKNIDEIEIRRDVRGLPMGSHTNLLGGSNAQEVKGMLDRYDKWHIGEPSHLAGITDWEGIDVDSTDSPKRVRPNELHLWTPAARRETYGFPRMTKHAPIIPRVPVLDTEAIKLKWEGIEHRQIPAEEGVAYRTHAERRAAELEHYQDNSDRSGGSEATRPSTSMVNVTDGPDGKVTIDCFRKLQTSEGIFISALESSSDWRTSYDFLGPVKSGIQKQFSISEERETINRPPKAGHNTTVDPIEFEKRYRLLVGSAPKPTIPAPKPTIPEPNPTTRGPKLTIRAPKPPIPAGKGKGKKKVEVQVDVFLQYPYHVKDLQDIEGRSNQSGVYLDPSDEKSTQITTEWCEETEGRREWHAGMLLSPASSVDSPPHEWVDVDPNTIPPEFPDGKVEAFEGPKRRCKHNPDRCRAWWTHSPDECWVVQPEQVPRPLPPNPTLHPLMTIAPPGDFQLPKSGRHIYGERIEDNYGLNGKEGAYWPRIGIRVPYEPMTYDDLKKNRLRGRKGASGGEKSKVSEVHSLAVPLITMAPPKAYGPLGNEGVSEPAEPAEGAEGGEVSEASVASIDSDSDVENDVFLISYTECSSTGA
ncbi:hypothetical protein GMOD_00003535 [Pyrenophora seminiperda CCB06]|uniref:Uncharacterized protein n=1 Tax=Pyrenophora seminiperda CCB06 TaxID=1302712 RepID=A0A3M7MJ74_9PLEO|nr:hypothetical protein GMOD_00003535 [Pyrenophora seminiperda CCB06]